MARVRSRVSAHQRHKAILEHAKGHRGKRHTNYKVAHESVMHALRYATEHRRDRKGDFRRLWIVRINAAARLNGLSYSRLISGLARAGIDLDRKALADLAVREPAAFARVAEQARAALA
ncbi:MAG: 50S ribosomal protein L20 [Chloroflexi bacterium]|nr:50S ribosomal protein L20 [Chloroflexota bacterium]